MNQEVRLDMYQLSSTSFDNKTVDELQFKRILNHSALIDWIQKTTPGIILMFLPSTHQPWNIASRRYQSIIWKKPSIASSSVDICSWRQWHQSTRIDLERCGFNFYLSPSTFWFTPSSPIFVSMEWFQVSKPLNVPSANPDTKCQSLTLRVMFKPTYPVEFVHVDGADRLCLGGSF